MQEIPFPELLSKVAPFRRESDFRAILDIWKDETFQFLKYVASTSNGNGV